MKLKVVFLYVFEFLRDGYYVTIFLLLPFIAKELNLNLFQVGSFQTVINVLSIGLAIPSAYFSAKFGGLKILLFSILLYSIGFLGISFADSYQFLLVIFFITGIGFSFYAVISPQLITSWSSKETRGKEMGSLMATGDVAKAIFSVLIGFFVGLIGWRVTSLSVGALTASVFLTFAYIYHKYLNKENNQETKKENVVPLSYKSFLKQKKFILALLANGLDMAVNIPLYAFLPFLLLFKGVPVLWLGIFTALYYAGNILSRLIFGRLVDRIGNAKIFIFLELTMAIILLLLVLSPTIYFTGILALALGFITEGTDPASLSMVAQSLERLQNSKRAYGIRAITNGIAKTFAPLLLGIIAGNYGIIGVFYTLIFVTLLPVIPAWLFLVSKED